MDDLTKKMLEEMDSPMKRALEAIENSPLQKSLAAIEGSRFAELVKTIESSRPALDYDFPSIRPPEIPSLPTHEETLEYQSAGILVQRLANSIRQWRRQLPSDQQPAILAILNGGIQINVERLAEESFHGIRIEGKIGGNRCMVLAHQATVQLLCYIEKIEKEEHRRSIGFVWDGKEQQV